MSTISEAIDGGPPRPAAYRTLEAWRGFAALWVVLCHALLTSAPSPGRWLLQSPDTAFLARGRLGVAIFFVISGYCIANAAVSARSRPRPITSFLWARARRIYPPYYFSTALWIIALLIHSAAGGPSAGTHADIRAQFLDEGPLYYVALLTLTQIPLGQPLYLVILWSLCYEVAFYAIVAAALGLTLRARGPWAILYVLHALTLGTMAWLVLARASCPFPWNLWPQFGFGVFVYQIVASPRKGPPALLLAMACALSIAYAWEPRPEEFLDTSPEFNLGFGLAYALLLIAIRGADVVLGRTPVVRLLAWVGTFSYTLYLTHAVAETICGKMFRALAGGAVNYRLQTVVETAASVAFARLFFIWAERPFLGARAPRPSEPDAVPPTAAPVAITPSLDIRGA